MCESESVAKVQLQIITGLQGTDGGTNFVQMVLDFGPTGRGQNQDGELSTAQVLLTLEVLIRGDLGLEAFCFRRLNQIAVLQIAPTPLKSRHDNMPDERATQGSGCSLVEEDFHPRSSGFGDDEALAGEFQNRFNLLLGDSRKPLQELAHCGPVFQIFEQRLHWNAGAAKNPCATDLAGHTFHC